MGLWHASVHVWLYTPSGALLIQQRASDKDTHPLFWDVSVAGHIGAGEDPLDSAVREVGEEVGLSIEKRDLEKLGIFRSEHIHGAEFVDREFHHTYICGLHRPLSALVKQDSEVAQLALISLDDFLRQTAIPQKNKPFVAYEGDYYGSVVEAIRLRLA